MGDKGNEFAGIVKMGRTQLQDAVPMTLGQEFRAYATHIGYDIESMEGAVKRLHFCNLGGTAIGTGIAADPKFSQEVVRELRAVTSWDDMQLADDLIEASSSVSAMLFLS